MPWHLETVDPDTVSGEAVLDTIGLGDHRALHTLAVRMFKFASNLPFNDSVAAASLADSTFLLLWEIQARILSFACFPSMLDQKLMLLFKNTNEELHAVRTFILVGADDELRHNMLLQDDSCKELLGQTIASFI